MPRCQGEVHDKACGLCYGFREERQEGCVVSQAHWEKQHMSWTKNGWDVNGPREGSRKRCGVDSEQQRPSRTRAAFQAVFVPHRPLAQGWTHLPKKR